MNMMLVSEERVMTDAIYEVDKVMDGTELKKISPELSEDMLLLDIEEEMELGGSESEDTSTRGEQSVGIPDGDSQWERYYVSGFVIRTHNGHALTITANVELQYNVDYTWDDGVSIDSTDLIDSRVTFDVDVDEQYEKLTKASYEDVVKLIKEL